MVKRVTGYGTGDPKIQLAPVPVKFPNVIPNAGATIPTSPTAYDFGQLIYNPATAAWYIYSGGSSFLNLVGGAGSFSSLTVTGAITAGTTITAGTGMTITTGNLTIAGTGAGFVLPVVAPVAGASPIVANGRVVQATFSGVSIAAGATQTLTITNSAITSATTHLHISFWGATTGAALTIQSVTPGSGTVAIVMQNGTGATTTTANITFNVIVED